MSAVAKPKGAVKKAAKPAKTVKRATKVAAPPPKPTLPAIAVKPKRPGRPSMPLPPPPPPPPAHRDEMIAPRDIGRLLRYGEQFGPHKIDIRMLPIQRPAGSGALAVADPSVPKSWRVFDRPVPGGQFRVMLSVARSGDKERLAAIVIHVGRPPIEKWTVAHFKGQKKPKTSDELPRVSVTGGWLVLLDAGAGSPGPIAVPPATGIQPLEIPLNDGRRALALPCGEGELSAYWAVDASDKPVCLVVDFEVFSQKDWKSKPS
ncbi:hypothetical protein BH11MYX3_BH11MYX3_00850 [soil metagenome]